MPDHYHFGQEKTIRSFNEIDAFKKSSENLLVILDVDDTLITPIDLCFRFNQGKNPYRYMLRDLKADYQNGTLEQKKFENILGHFRLQRKTQLTEPAWPEVISDLKKNNNSVIALTHLQTGSFGPIPSVEQWRFQELKEHGILFSKWLNPEQAKQFNQTFENEASYFKGIFITTHSNKHEVIEALISDYLLKKPNAIVFVDDRPALVQAVSKTLEKLKMPFETYCYAGAHHLPGRPDPAIAEFQKTQLFTHYIWYSDQQAEVQINHLRS